MERESKSERFKRIASKRTNEVLEKLRILGNLSNKSSYIYTDEEVDKIFSEINKQLRIVRQKFTFQDKTKFKL